jgi:D-alanyl-D-alanine carboxypeptidase
MSLLPNFYRHVLAPTFVALGVMTLMAGTKVYGEAKLLIEASTGKVLKSENATQPWYPASVTKLMTTYTTLRALKADRISLNSLLTVSANAAAQEPTKMGFPIGTRITVDNALKMLLVKSANDMAVVIAEGVGGSIDGFANMMNADAQRLGMTQSHFVNPNGLPADNHVTSARDLAILARALINEFPEYDSYWHIHSIRYGKRVIHNYNSLLDRYPGADGMKTGFICAAGYNLVASATRNGQRLIAVVLGAYSGGARAQEAAQLLESGFSGTGLMSSTNSHSTLDGLTPIDAQPPDLHEDMCGRHRRKPPSEANDEEETGTGSDANNGQVAMSSGLTSSKFVLGPSTDISPPVVVFTGPSDHPDPVIEVALAKKKKRTKTKHLAKADPSGQQKTKPAHNKAGHARKKSVKPKISSTTP